jgi:hypothetical protein
MNKTITIPEDVKKKLHKRAIDVNKDLKTFIQDILIELVKNDK